SSSYDRDICGGMYPPFTRYSRLSWDTALLSAINKKMHGGGIPGPQSDPFFGKYPLCRYPDRRTEIWHAGISLWIIFYRICGTVCRDPIFCTDSYKGNPYPDITSPEMAGDPGGAIQLCD